MWAATGEFGKRGRVCQNRNGLRLELLFFTRSWPDIYPAAEDLMDKDVIEGELSQTESAACDDKAPLGTTLSSRCFSAASASCCFFLLKGLANGAESWMRGIHKVTVGGCQKCKANIPHTSSTCLQKSKFAAPDCWCSNSQSVIVFSQFSNVNCHSEYKYSTAHHKMWDQNKCSTFELLKP